MAHNYGHGGSGWTEAPGSAMHVIGNLLKATEAAGMTNHEPVTIVGAGIIGKGQEQKEVLLFLSILQP